MAVFTHLKYLNSLIKAAPNGIGNYFKIHTVFLNHIQLSEALLAVAVIKTKNCMSAQNIEFRFRESAIKTNAVKNKNSTLLLGIIP